MEIQTRRVHILGVLEPVPLEYSVAWLTCAVADSWTW
jgi:hypothetical protein